MSESSVRPASTPPAAESVPLLDDLVEALRGSTAIPGEPPAAGVRPTADRAAFGTLPYRPTLRRPMALVHVVDDGREGGEVVRMRGDRLVIGRADGDIVIPHDISMSPLHAAIERLGETGWQLLDLGSAAGTFVRVTSARLASGTVFQIGRSRLRFEELAATTAWLVEQQPDGADRRHECHGPAATIGRAGGGCDVGLRDPFVSPVHATLRRTPRGWRIANSGWNGLWVRIDTPVRMTAVSQFLCGEQRFVFEPLA